MPFVKLDVRRFGRFVTVFGDIVHSKPGTLYKDDDFAFYVGQDETSIATWHSGQYDIYIHAKGTAERLFPSKDEARRFVDMLNYVVDVINEGAYMP